LSQEDETYVWAIPATTSLMRCRRGYGHGEEAMRQFHQEWRTAVPSGPHRCAGVLRSCCLTVPSFSALSALAITHTRTVTPTSETVRNTSGLSSVVILFTELEWHLIVLCFHPERVETPRMRRVECGYFRTNVEDLNQAIPSCCGPARSYPFVN